MKNDKVVLLNKPVEILYDKSEEGKIVYSKHNTQVHISPNGKIRMDCYPKSYIYILHLENQMEKLQQENQRLNNILNELEEGYKECLEKDLKLAKKYGCTMNITLIEASKSFLKTIQRLKEKYELKEGNK